MDLDDRNPKEFPQLESRAAYDRFYQETMFEEGRRPNAITWNPQSMRYFQPASGSSILELGSGVGGNIIVYSSRGCRCVGVELATVNIAYGYAKMKKHYPMCLPNVTMAQGRIEDFHSPDRFDHVLITEVLEHVLDPVPVLAIACEHLNDDGEVYITAPDRS